ncbi:agmatine deiminase family protein [Streptomyces albiaxialis]|uniref:Agmatine deiminase family protein n=1 Tax=Streptomyces albiaxialis TaxID=329523 RepID=A0ABN2VJ85_9ACTN
MPHTPARRAVLRLGAALAGAGVLGAADPAVAAPGAQKGVQGPWRMPDERSPHSRTFMAWPPEGPVWGAWAPRVRRDIAALARAIAEYEPVVLLARPGDVRDARCRTGGAAEVWPVPVDDLWVRDTGPVSVLRADGARAGLDLGFNGWGGKQTHFHDHRVARRVLRRTGTPRIRPGLVAEGGSLEADGQGTLLVTESSLVNANRNPGLSRDEIERVLKHALGVEKVIWLRGVRGHDITDCHVDALARFAAPGVVVLSRPSRDAGPVWAGVYAQAREVLREATDARGRRLTLVELPEAEPSELGDRGEDFLASYVNHYVCNGAVILPRFGDRRGDARAVSLLRDLHPDREVRQVAIDTVAEGGGGVHCATQQETAPGA